jgi:DNA-damage-inducible protein J
MMSKTACINVRMEPAIKEKAERLFAEFGITTADAINIFIHKSLMVGGLPFDVRKNISKPIAAASLSETELNQELAKGYDDHENGRVTLAAESFAKMNKDFRI